MCFGKPPKIDMPPPPVVTPVETAPAKTSPETAGAALAAQVPLPPAAPQVTDVSPQATAEARRKKIAAARYGMASTIKTGPQGILAPGTALAGNEQGKKKTLGS